MGLDMRPLARPHAGKEAEFEELWRSYQIAVGNLKPTTGQEPPKSFRSRLIAIWAPSEFAKDPHDLQIRLEAISEPAYETLGAPVVGVDPEADAWLEQRIADGHFTDNSDPDEIRKNMRGYCVLDLLPENDGLPYYSNAPHYGLERTSFRGSFLEDCVALLGNSLVSQAWNPMLAHDLMSYGEELRATAHAAAQKAGLLHLLGKREGPEADKSVASQIHIANSCGRWCIYWAERGHGMDPDY